MSVMASQINGVLIVYSTVCSGVDQRKYQSSASLAFVRGIHRWPVTSPHKGPITQRMFSFDDVNIFAGSSRRYLTTLVIPSHVNPANGWARQCVIKLWYLNFCSESRMKMRIFFKGRHTWQYNQGNTIICVMFPCNYSTVNWAIGGNVWMFSLRIVYSVVFTDICV